MEGGYEPGSDRDRGGAQLKCCCGQAACAYLEHNNTALGGLERDLETAARLGQALLSRHESYISESQAEHARMSAYISELEFERTSLQSANEKIVAENRNLLSQLETLNTTLASSDEEVRRLENLLLDCEFELKRLNGFVRRAEELDGKVHDMEIERQALTRQLSEGRDETRGTLARWRESERKVRELEEDVRRIEREAMQEREKHQEIMARVEKERMLERELGGAEGRLKGAAAMQSIQNGPNGGAAAASKNVVSHFVRDILQDNANLQAGIAELRQLLQSSNEEVQNLREQIMLHQPVAEEDDETQPDSTQQRSASLSLGEEMAQLQHSPQQQSVQQEVHVHHHYHAKLAKKERTPAVRRPSRKRAIIPPYSGHYPPSGESFSGASTPFSFHHPQPKRNNRWSVQSSTTQSSVLSSIPSSPRSYFDRGGYLFDRMDQQGGEDYYSSRPTSPESVADFQQQNWKQTQPQSQTQTHAHSQGQAKGEDVGLGIFEEEFTTDEGEVVSPLTSQGQYKSQSESLEMSQEDSVQQDIAEAHNAIESDRRDNTSRDVEQQDTIQEQVVLLPEQQSELELTPKPCILVHRTTEDSENWTTPGKRASDSTTSDPIPLALSENYNSHPREKPTLETATTATARNSSKSVLDNLPEIRPSLTRRGSHESLVSISGMDIHLAQRPAPAATLELLRGNSAHFALSPTQSRKISASQPLASVTEYTVLSSSGFESSPSTLKSVRRVPSSIEALSGIAVPAPRSARSPQASGALSKLVGGWVRGKWGIAPTKSNPSLRVVSSPSTQHSKSETCSIAPSTSSAADSTKITDGVIVGESSSALSSINQVDNAVLSLSTTPTSTVDSSNTTASPPKAIPNVSTDQTSSHQARHSRSHSSTHTGPSSPTAHLKVKMSYPDPYLDPGMLFAGRSPGVNQPGFMAGFRQTRNPSVIEPQAVDEEGLREGLDG